MIKHPKDLDFQLGLKFQIINKTVNKDNKEYMPLKNEKYGFVYVALLAGTNQLKILKIGQTFGSLKDRWERTLSIFNRGGSLRPNEEDD
ncbi:MAG TPA: hypothetical protein VMU88_00885 [bacterium]|nr:hypothetical protein [bacterium]